MLEQILQRPIAFHRIFAQISGSATSGLFLSQLWYWKDKGSDPEGWIYKSYDEWHEETLLSRSELDRARKSLKMLGILEEKKEGLPCRIYYRINETTLIEAIEGKSKELTTEEIISAYESTLNGLSKTSLMRAQKKGAKAEFVDYKEILRKKGCQCGICQKPISKGCGNKGDSLVFDHIIPINEGGSHTFDNLQPAHAYCNTLKKGETKLDSTKQTSLSSQSKLDCLGETNLPAYTKQTRLSKQSNQDCLTEANILYTETTSENTTETTKDHAHGEAHARKTFKGKNFPEEEPVANESIKPNMENSFLETNNDLDMANYSENSLRKEKPLSKAGTREKTEEGLILPKEQQRDFWRALTAYIEKTNPKISRGRAESIASASTERLLNRIPKVQDQEYLDMYLQGILPCYTDDRINYQTIKEHQTLEKLRGMLYD